MRVACLYGATRALDDAFRRVSARNNRRILLMGNNSSFFFLYRIKAFEFIRAYWYWLCHRADFIGKSDPAEVTN